MRRIITVGREFGSGGREIGRRESQKNCKLLTTIRKLLRKSQKEQRCPKHISGR